MSWQYRPCKIVHKDGTFHFDIRAFYTLESGGAWSAEAQNASGETLKELKSDLFKMTEGVQKNELLILYVYTCEDCKEDDARTEKDRTKCKECELKSSVN